MSKEIFPKKDVIIYGDYDIVRPSKYKARTNTTFETADSRCYTRHLENTKIARSLRRKFPELSKEYIFNSSGFDGTFVEYIADKLKIDINEVYKLAGSKESILNIPSYLKSRSS